jgi:hypothetical protein
MQQQKQMQPETNHNAAAAADDHKADALRKQCNSSSNVMQLQNERS